MGAVGSKRQRIRPQRERAAATFLPRDRVERDQDALVAGKRKHGLSVRRLADAGHPWTHRHLAHARAALAVHDVQALHPLFLFASDAGEQKVRAAMRNERRPRAHHAVEGLPLRSRRQVDAGHVVGPVVGAVQQVAFGRKGQRHGPSARAGLDAAAFGGIGAIVEAHGRKTHHADHGSERSIDHVDAAQKVVGRIHAAARRVEAESQRLVAGGHRAGLRRVGTRNHPQLAPARASHENGAGSPGQRRGVLPHGQALHHGSRGKVHHGQRVACVLRHACHARPKRTRLRGRGGRRLLRSLCFLRRLLFGSRAALGGAAARKRACGHARKGGARQVHEPPARDHAQPLPLSSHALAQAARRASSRRGRRVRLTPVRQRRAARPRPVRRPCRPGARTPGRASPRPPRALPLRRNP